MRISAILSDVQSEGERFEFEVRVFQQLHGTVLNIDRDERILQHEHIVDGELAKGGISVRAFATNCISIDFILNDRKVITQILLRAGK